eukprot:CAMPEP_0197448370 /NCGR_PEP_ID=MMETSP1175-20131217/17185_1 /TAXON_ID=1003142 /ORGANISM="Triceratium dubium, Strain CCMP147" /LENGTH=69 /DNA_ID=CAMNT_0042980085 /DNA_START=56 /DNA_END=261 /DNA_ORIENTATION=-
MKLLFAITALLAAPSVAKVETDKANVRGVKQNMGEVPAELLEKKRQMDDAIKLIRSLQDGEVSWGDIAP